MKTVDVFAVKKEVVQRARTKSTSAQTLMVVRNEMQPSALSPDRKRTLPLVLRWPLFPSVRQKLILGASKSLTAGNNPEVLLVPKYLSIWFYKKVHSSFTLGPRFSKVLSTQSAHCSPRLLIPQCKCSVSDADVFLSGGPKWWNGDFRL